MFNIRTSTSHKVYRFRNQKFWAENGAIHIIDQRDGKQQTVSLREFLLRADAFNHARKRGAWSDERIEEQKAVEDMIRCAMDAKEQGDLFDMRVRRDKLRAKGIEVDISPPDPRKLPQIPGKKVRGTIVSGGLYGRNLPRTNFVTR